MDKSNFKTVAIWVMVNEDGEYEVGVTSDEADERFDENIAGTGGRRLIRLDVNLPLPKPLAYNVNVPETVDGPVTVEAA